MEAPPPEKDIPVDTVSPLDDTTKDDAFDSAYDDQVHMARMGKKQEMNRVFRQVSLISFTAVCMSTWEWMVMSNTQGLTDGGRAGLFWGYLWTFAGYGFIAASLAEMAAMAPTAGGQYHWTSEFASPSLQRPLSYFSGWMSALSWQSANASGMFLQGFMIQSLISFRDPSYTLPAYQTWILVVVVTSLCSVCNIFGEKWLPRMQYVAMFLHVAGWLATIIVLWALGPRISAREALLDFSNLGGWSSTGLALMVGQLTVVFALAGSDAAAHISEEVKHSGLTVPRAIFWTMVINGSMGFIVTVAFIFALPDVNAAINDPSGFSMVYVFRLCGGEASAIGLVLVQLILITFGNIAFQAAVARQTFAFARDGGFPLSNWIAKVNKRWVVPVNAVLFSAAFSVLICLIDLGSSDAFNAILSLAAVAQMATYTLSIGCVLYRRMTAPHLLPKNSWTLGRWGVPINVVALGFSSVVWFFMFWPASIPVDASSMNWAVVMFFGIMGIATFFFVVKARKTYFGPVTKVQRIE